MNYFNESLHQMLLLINEMSPYILLGFLFAGIMHVFVPRTLYSKYLSKNNFSSALYAALLGIPLPLCSCGVLPTAMSLRKEGASKGATISFLIATPETGVDSIAATYSIMGLPFAIVRPITAFFTSLFAGTLVNIFESSTKTSCCCHEEEHEEKHCCCHEEKNEEEHCCRHEEKHEEGHCCCCCHEGHDSPSEKYEGALGKIHKALRYAFIDMMGDIGKWLVIGLVIASLITVFVPDSFFEIFKGNTALSMLLVLCIAIPMYICATGSIPIAVALIMKGLTPGAALVLLMAGPACNIASMLVINKSLGRRTLLLYLASIITCAVSAGFIIDSLPAAWFMPSLMQATCCDADATSWTNYTCTAILILLLLNTASKKLLHNNK